MKAKPPPDIAYLDEMLLSYVREEWRKSAYVIGRAMDSCRENELVIPADRFLATRLQALADTGRIEAIGDLRKIGFSEARLPAGKA